MPYIPQDQRPALDEQLEKLLVVLQQDNSSILDAAGKLNFVITQLCLGLIAGNVPSYKSVAVITGVLTNVSQEFYRRWASVLEDRKSRENGDIPGYWSMEVSK